MSTPNVRRAFPALLVAHALSLASVFAQPLSPARPLADSRTTRQLFANPPADYSTGPLWVWNDLLDEREVRETLRDLAGQGVMQAFVHPRPGLMTPYLSPEWFRLWKIAVDEARRLGMKLWIYDENSYPSGFAGGLVPDAMPESRGLGLSLTETNQPPAWKDNTLAVHRLSGDAAENVTAAAKAGSVLPAGRYVTASRLTANPSPWFGNRTYVNLLTPGVTEKFLALTHDAYRRELGAEFGALIPGTFTDEPQVRPAGGLPWCDDLPARFRERWGYDLLDALPALTTESGDWRRVRHNYLHLINELFVARWARPYFEYCERHRLELTGHYWEHEWPRCGSVPDNMTMAAWQQRPGIDTLMNEYADGPHAQFGNARAVREVASIANQLGRARTLSEAYGAGGWDLRFEDMKRIGDWLLVLGVNTIDQHLSYVTIRGGRKRDHPQSFSYHEPWWRDYHVVARYLARLSAALAQGEQRNDVLLLEPTTSAWMLNFGKHSAAALEKLGENFQETVNAFEAAQLDYDLGSEYVLAQHGSARDGRLVVGRRDYRIVVVPALTENLNVPTLTLLAEFLRTDGTVIALGDPPVRIDGAPDPRGPALARATGWKPLPAAEAVRVLEAPALSPVEGRTAAQFAIRRADGDRGILFHQRRRLADGELLFLVNTSNEHPSAGTLTAAAARSAERWDPETGRVAPYAFRTDAAGLAADFKLPPSGSLLLWLSPQTGPAAPAAAAAPVAVAPLAPPEVRRDEPNVLTLDFVDVTAGGETRRDQYCYAAAQFAFQKNGEPRNPWESAVQTGDELLRRTYPATSGFSATYRFTLEGAVPANLALVVERPDLYRIACNGQPVAATPGAWWLDKAFGSVPLAAAARAGENTVTITASPLTHFHELEPAYLRGDFRLRATPAGFTVVADAPLQLGPWREQGLPFYGGAITYRQRFNVSDPTGEFAVVLPAWLGSVARVRVNGADAGTIAWPPWRCDVSRFVRAGENTIEVTVVGTLKNPLGPHHGKPPLGRAWPAGFRAAPKSGRAPGADYSTVGYGLFAPFVLTRESPPRT